MKKIFAMVSVMTFLLGTATSVAAPLSDYSTPGTVDVHLRYQEGAYIGMTIVVSENWGVEFAYRHYSEDVSAFLFSAAHNNIYLRAKHMAYKKDQLTIVPYLGFGYSEYDRPNPDSFLAITNRLTDSSTAFSMGAAFIYEFSERLKGFFDLGVFIGSWAESTEWDLGISYALSPTSDLGLYYGNYGFGVGLTFKFYSQ